MCGIMNTIQEACATLFSMHGFVPTTLGTDIIDVRMRTLATHKGWGVDVTVCDDGSKVWTVSRRIDCGKHGPLVVEGEYITHRHGVYDRVMLWRIFVGKDGNQECVIEVGPLVEPDEQYDGEPYEMDIQLPRFSPHMHVYHAFIRVVETFRYGM